VSSVVAAVINVPADHATIQAAIDAVEDGDEIVVQPGRYVENIRFHGKNITLRSVDPEDLAVVEATIIDGNQAGTVVTFAGTETEACLLTGLTIANGWSEYGGGINGGRRFGAPGTSTRAEIVSNIIRDNTGSGVHGYAGRLTDNVIVRNDSEEWEECIWHDLGGGDGYWECYWVGGDDGGGCRLCGGLIERNLIIDNYAFVEGGALSYSTGTTRYNLILLNTSWGDIVSRHSGVLESNIIADNASDDGALGGCGSVVNNIVVRNRGNGISFSGQSGRIQGNFIANNRIYQIYGSGNVYGNALVGSASFTGLIVRCDGVYNNVVAFNGTPTSGGRVLSSSSDVIGNMIAYNQSYDSAILHGRGLIANNTIIGNRVRYQSGGISETPELFTSHIVIIINNILWNNRGPIEDQLYDSDIPTYSCIENDVSGEPTNISLDPKFVDPENGDFSLRPDSPCIDAGAYVPEAAFDILGRPRGFDGSPEPRGDGSDFDIGAFEFIMNIVGEGEGEGEAGPHSADLDADWRISMHELLRVVQFYNTHGYHCAEGTEDGYRPGREAESPQRHKEHRGITEDTEQRGWVNPLEVTRSPLVEAYMKKHGIKLPEIPEQHIKLWRAWVTKQSTTQTKVQACAPHSSDYAPQDWHISITELLRIIQFFNAGAYHRCDHGEDGFCPGAP